MEKYTLVCTDGKDTSTNQFQSLEEIIAFIVEWYATKNLSGYELTIEQGKLCLFYEISETLVYEHKAEQSEKAVADMLNEIARNHDKEHTYTIIEN